jgi:cysteine dioxygenase
MIWPYLHVAETQAHMYRAILSHGSHANNVLRQLILVWSPGKGSAIHDHANAHCVMKVLKGSLRETLYTWPDQDKLQNGQASSPQIIKETTYTENQVTYMSDKVCKFPPTSLRRMIIRD